MVEPSPATWDWQLLPSSSSSGLSPTQGLQLLDFTRPVPPMQLRIPFPGGCHRVNPAPGL